MEINPLSGSILDGRQQPVQLKAVGSGYWRMIGSAEQLLEKAEAIGQRWLKGVAIARQIQKA